jgi:hypothetical protein
MSDRATEESGPRSARALLGEAILRAASGYVLSLLVSGVLIVLILVGFGPAVALERVGIDLGMRIAAAVSSPQATQSATPSYIFLDVDVQACQRFMGARGDICTRHTVPMDMLLALATAAAQSHAAMIIVDVDPPDATSDRSALYRDLAALAGPWVIAPLPARPTRTLDLVVEPSTGIPNQGWRLGQLWLAPFVTFADPEAGDGVVRGFPALFKVAGKTERWIPSAPFLAAALSADAHNRVVLDCVFYAATSCAGASLNLAGRRIAVRSAGDLEELASNYRQRPLFFSFISTLVRGESGRNAQRYFGRFDRFSVGRLVTSKHVFSIPQDRLANRVVVIGSSDPASNDFHATPLGAMVGPELIVNATRAFAQDRPLDTLAAHASQPDAISFAFATLWEKAKGIFVPALGLTLVWWAVLGIAASMGRRMLAIRFLGALLCCVVFIGGFSILALFELSERSGELLVSAASGHAVDMVTPIALLGLEAYAEASKKILTLIEEGIISCRDGVGRGIATVRDHLFRNFPGTDL